MTFLKETEANFLKFSKEWEDSALRNKNTLHKEEQYLQSYRRMAALQSLKIDILQPSLSVESMAFINEAHNDALFSHVAASMGAWRSSLQSLRSCLENCLCGLYYNDHPVELRRWEIGSFRIGFTDLLNYFEEHPDISFLKPPINPVPTLRAEYAELSKAVHGSRKNFRMTDSISKSLLWDVKKDRCGKWATREKKSLGALSILVIILYKKDLEGAKKSSTRMALSMLFDETLKRKIKSDIGVSIIKAK